MENKKVIIPKMPDDIYLPLDVDEKRPGRCEPPAYSIKCSDEKIVDIIDMKGYQNGEERVYVIPDILSEDERYCKSIYLDNCISGGGDVTIVYVGESKVILYSYQGNYNDGCLSFDSQVTKINLILPEDMALFDLAVNSNYYETDRWTHFAIIAPKGYDAALKSRKEPHFGIEFLDDDWDDESTFSCCPCTTFNKTENCKGIVLNQDLVYNRETQAIEPRTAELSLYPKGNMNGLNLDNV